MKYVIELNYGYIETTYGIYHTFRITDPEDKTKKDMIDVIAKRDRSNAQVGDRVIVRSWADIQAHRETYPILQAFTGLMKYMCEKTGKIQEINGDIIEITFDDPTCSQDGFIMSTDMIELLD